MASVYPGSGNVFVRDHSATNGMVVDYSRNIEKFALNKYVQYRTVSKEAGYYLAMDVEEAGRLTTTDGSQFVWGDGQPASEGNGETEKHEYLQYQTSRFEYPVALGDKLVDQATWDIVQQYSRMKGQQAMTNRTQQAITVLTTGANYASGHTSAVSSISGNTGTWTASTTARQDIKRSLNFAAETILDSTLAGLELEDLILVVSSGAAEKMSLAQEIVDHIKHSDLALAQIKGDLPGRNAIYGLPDKLYGFPVVVEKTRKTTNIRGATKSVSSVHPEASPFMAARPGSLESPEGGPTFSTCTLFLFEEMTVETLRDLEWNRRTLVRVVDDFVAIMTSSISGFLFTSAV